MDCPDCATPNSSDSLFCNHCGGPLTALAVGIKRKKEASEKKTREIELTEAVATRLLKWSKILGYYVAALAILFSLLLGKGYLDTRSAINASKDEINTATADGKNQIQVSMEDSKRDLLAARKDLPGLASDIQRLKIEVGNYQNVNQHIEKLQADLLHLQNDVVDLGHKTLRVNKLETTGSGPGIFGFGQPGCSAEEAVGSPVSFCAQGSPLEFTLMTPDGKTRPVSSYSDRGFQDISSAPRPTCTEQIRGTIYVEKGGSRKADRPFVCIKEESEAYSWLQLSTRN